MAAGPPIFASRSMKAVGHAPRRRLRLYGASASSIAFGRTVVGLSERLAVACRSRRVRRAASRLLDLLLGREVDRRVVGRVDHVLANQDQAASRGEVVDRAAVVAGVDDGGGVGGEAAQVLRHGEAGIDRLGTLEEGLERDRRRLLPEAISLEAVS